jgi:integrase
MAKGKVAIESDKDWLRLRFTAQGKRYAFALGLPDTKVNRKIAAARATQIELDILSNNFDRTLTKYRPEKEILSQQKYLSVVEIFDQYLAEKTKQIDRRTLEKYQTVRSHLLNFFGTATQIDTKDAESFQDSLQGSKHTIKRKLQMLKACWQWAIAEELTTDNPWDKLPGRIRVPASEFPKPFTKEEVQTILTAFQVSSPYNYLYDFVYFLFGTGLRTGEAIGLCWKNVSLDCRGIEVVEMVSRGVRKSTKTNKSRQFKLSPEMATILRARRPAIYKPDDLVFPSTSGKPLDDHNFRNRAWKTILDLAKVPYRKPYNTRHTFISHCLAAGMNPMLVAQLTGHDPQVLFEHYAASIESSPSIPSLF